MRAYFSVHISQVSLGGGALRLPSDLVCHANSPPAGVGLSVFWMRDGGHVLRLAAVCVRARACMNFCAGIGTRQRLICMGGGGSQAVAARLAKTHNNLSDVVNVTMVIYG